jgi:hypothetical protein
MASEQAKTFRIHYKSGFGPEDRSSEDIKATEHTQPRPGERADWFVFYDYDDRGEIKAILTIPAEGVWRIEEVRDTEDA